MMYFISQGTDGLFSQVYGYVICLGIILLISVVAGMMGIMFGALRRN